MISSDSLTVCIKRNGIALLLLLLLLVNCKPKKEVSPEPDPSLNQSGTIPEIKTNVLSSISDSSAISGGSIIATGTVAIYATGICWDSIPGPTTADAHTFNSATLTSFGGTLDQLRPGNTYYVRAYIANGEGVYYGNELAFTTLSIWTKMNVPMLSNYTVTCFESEGASVFAGTSNGVLFSPDTGITWQNAGLGNASIKCMATMGGTVFAGSGTKVYRSINNGSTWQAVTNGFPAFYYGIQALKVSGGNVYAVSDKGVYVSTDAGNNWTAINNGLVLGSNILYADMTINGAEMCTVCNDFSTLSLKLYRSNDNGTNWSPVNTGGLMPLQTALHLCNSSSNVFLSTNKGIYSSTNNGMDWLANTALPAKATLFSTKDSEVFNYSYDGVLSLSTNNGTTWTKLSNKGLSSIDISAVSLTGRYLYVATNTSEIFAFKRSNH